MNAHIPPTETAFERTRGINRVEVRSGFAQVYVTGLGPVPSSSRLEVLRSVAQAGVSIDFLKLTPGGLSFLASADKAEAVDQALKDFDAQVLRGRSIVLVHAVNIRDEEGLIARIVREVISENIAIDHVGDMHDRLLLVMDEAGAQRVQSRLNKVRLEVS
jgi:aspartokinase